MPIPECASLTPGQFASCQMWETKVKLRDLNDGKATYIYPQKELMYEASFNWRFFYPVLVVLTMVLMVLTMVPMVGGEDSRFTYFRLCVSEES